MSYFVSPPDEISWEFDVSGFRARLAEWEDIAIREPTDPTGFHSLEWNVPLRFGDLFGSLDRSGQVVHMDGFLGDCALFAIWLRTLVPESVELLFYDDAYSADVALVSLTREEDFVQAFGS